MRCIFQTEKLEKLFLKLLSSRDFSFHVKAEMNDSVGTKLKLQNSTDTCRHYFLVVCCIIGQGWQTNMKLLGNFFVKFRKHHNWWNLFINSIGNQKPDQINRKKTHFQTCLDLFEFVCLFVCLNLKKEYFFFMINCFDV